MELTCCAETQPGTPAVGLPAVSYRFFTTRNIRFRGAASMSFSIGQTRNRIRTAGDRRWIGVQTLRRAVRKSCRPCDSYLGLSVAYSAGRTGLSAGFVDGIPANGLPRQKRD